MDTIKILDRNFRLSITHETIQEKVKEVAKQLNKDYEGKNPAMVCILNGAYMFAADLSRHLTFQPEIIFARFSSYEGMDTTGKVRELMGVSVNLHGRDVIIVEDIVDTGLTMYNVMPQFIAKGAKSVKICSFLQKPEKLQVDLKVDYVAIKIPNEFIVGYGLDYNGMGRNYKDIYTVVDDNNSKFKNMKNIIIFGAPGSGKGTYSDEIREKYGMNHISTGDVLRNEINKGSELGKIAKSYIDEGQLIPDSLMIDILANKYDSLDSSKGVIFDGFPRTIDQAEALKTMLKNRGHDMGMMIELIVDEDTLMARLLKRAKEQGRADDNEDTIRKRFSVYHNQTEPLSDWFENEGIRHTFTWKGSKELMLEEIFQKIEELNK